MVAAVSVLTIDVMKGFPLLHVLFCLPSMQRCYYLSMEFYMGRSLTNAMVNLGIDSSVEEALYEVSFFTCTCTLTSTRTLLMQIP